MKDANPKTTFIEAVRAMESLPAALREHADEVTALEEHRFDETWIEFLDTHIRLSPRGPEWTARLKHRHAALLPFTGVTLLRGRVKTEKANYTVEIHPVNRVVVHWEEYAQEDVG